MGIAGHAWSNVLAALLLRPLPAFLALICIISIATRTAINAKGIFASNVELMESVLNALNTIII